MNNYDIIILAGQSNAEGYGFGETKNPYIKSDLIWEIRDNQKTYFYKTETGADKLFVKEPWELEVKIAEEAMIENRLCGNFAHSFAGEYIRNGLLAQGRKLMIVKTPAGGTGFSSDEWGVGDILHRRLIDMVDFALGNGENNKIVAFLWHQGEHDVVENPHFNFEERKAFYYAKLKELFLNIKNRYHDHKFPFIAGEFTQAWMKDRKEACIAVLTAAQKVVDELCDSKIVSSEGLLSNIEENNEEDTVHFSKNSLYELGKRYFNEYVRIINK